MGSGNEKMGGRYHARKHAVQWDRIISNEREGACCTTILKKGVDWKYKVERQRWGILRLATYECSALVSVRTVSVESNAKNGRGSHVKRLKADSGLERIRNECGRHYS